MDKNLIPAKSYRKIVELVPIVCVDVIIFYNGKFVLGKRTNEPLKNKWWIVGGRAYKGEPSLKTAKRKMKSELGLKATDIILYGVYEDYYKKSAWGIQTSSVSIVYMAMIDKFNPKPDKTISDIKLADQLPIRLTKNLKLFQ